MATAVHPSTHVIDRTACRHCGLSRGQRGSSPRLGTAVAAIALNHRPRRTPPRRRRRYTTEAPNGPDLAKTFSPSLANRLASLLRDLHLHTRVRASSGAGREPQTLGQRENEKGREGER